MLFKRRIISTRTGKEGTYSRQMKLPSSSSLFLLPFFLLCEKRENEKRRKQIKGEVKFFEFFSFLFSRIDQSLIQRLNDV